MLTVTDATRLILLEDDVALQAAQSGILNFSAYAQQILPLIEERTMKLVKHGTVVVALTRIAEQLQNINKLRPEVELDDLSIRSPLCDITYSKSVVNMQRLTTLPQALNVSEHDFFTTTQSLSEITIIAPQSFLHTIKSHFLSSPKAVFTDQAGVTVRFSQQYLATPNMLYVLLAALAVHKINFTEIISSYTELSFIVEKKDLEIVMQVLQKFLG